MLRKPDLTCLSGVVCECSHAWEIERHYWESERDPDWTMQARCLPHTTWPPGAQQSICLGFCISGRTIRHHHHHHLINKTQINCSRFYLRSVLAENRADLTRIVSFAVVTGVVVVGGLERRVRRWDDIIYIWAGRAGQAPVWRSPRRLHQPAYPVLGQYYSYYSLPLLPSYTVMLCYVGTSYSQQQQR